MAGLNGVHIRHNQSGGSMGRRNLVLVERVWRVDGLCYPATRSELFFPSFPSYFACILFYFRRCFASSTPDRRTDSQTPEPGQRLADPPSCPRRPRDNGGANGSAKIFQRPGPVGLALGGHNARGAGYTAGKPGKRADRRKST